MEQGTRNVEVGSGVFTVLWRLNFDLTSLFEIP
jgi:hypothetical protein